VKGGNRLTVPEVAVALGVSKTAVRKAIARGTMKATVIVGGPRGSGTLNGYYDVEPAEVERYRREHLGRTLGREPKTEEAK
jgi:excisionase family DNA binding protein